MSQRYPLWATLVHFGYGLLAGLLGGWEMLAMTLVFLGYESLEQRKIQDKGYWETLEYAVGLTLGIILRLGIIVPTMMG